MKHTNKIKLALPKGRLWESTNELLQKSGINLNNRDRDYRPSSDQESVEFYIVKPRNIPKMVEQGLVDAGIVGIDLVEDEDAFVDQVLDLKTLPVFLVVAGKREAEDVHRGQNKIVVASEYEQITRKYFSRRGNNFNLLRTYGSTECFVPEFADLIVDHVQSGKSLKRNGLKVLDVILKSTTHLIANKNLPEEKNEILEGLRQKLALGLPKMDFNYPGFLNEEEVRTNSFLESGKQAATI